MEFRTAAKEDIPSLVKMRIAYSLETYGELSETFEKKMCLELPDYFERHLDKDLRAYIALDGSEVVSTALLLVIEKPINPLVPSGQNGVVLNVFTKLENRHKGLAARLMQMLLADAKSQGLDYVELKATKSGYPLYKKLGFSDKPENVYMIYNFERR